MTVSRETPPPPPEAAGVFRDQLPTMQRYAELLTTAGVERGLIGPREVDRLWGRHLVNCGLVEPRLPHGASVADVGTGAGLPGLVWAIARRDLQVTLIEPLLRRTTFLEEATETLALTNVTVVRARAEDVRDTFDVVTARAVASMDKLARWCMPLVAPGGVLLALKGQAAEAEVREARQTLKRLGARDTLVRTYGTEGVPTTVVEVSK